ncbi:Internalin A [Paenibacillus plantiphilus]|uniref:Internalin A n=1 Tax=Paenibacillus plantiphilus TaxID=2905650 RepID=A0ABM9CI08_9BACL|nr:leucine-rich repeat domain-containing protein [Paenibacillus plantiphilus]CAH1214537.1 Internalin A [Paenibacillus plantiphilus]
MMGQAAARSRTVKLMVAMVLLFCSMGTVGAAAESVDNAVVKFPDKALERAVRLLTGIDKGVLRQQDVQGITELVMTYETFGGETRTEDSMITDLTGIQQLTNLQVLDLRYYHKVDNVEPLAGLAKLHTIILWGNPVRDIKPLAKLSALKELDLSETKVDNLEPLRGHVQLEKLTLVDTPVKGIEMLPSLPKLRSLNLYSAEERKLDLATIGNLTNLEELDLVRKGADNIDFLRGLTKLKRLVLRGNYIQDYSLIGQLTDLEMLYIQENNIKKLDFVKSLVNLRELSVERGQIDDLQPLSGLTKLETLSLYDSRISSLKPLAPLTSLKKLNLDNNDIRDLAPLSSLHELELLTLNNNKVSDIAPIANMKKLKRLELQNNNIGSLRSLAALDELTYLTILRNVIPVDGEPEAAALRDRILQAGGTFEYEAYKPFPNIVLFLYGSRVYANGQYEELAIPAFVEAGRTMVPIRFISEQLDAEVSWDSKGKGITVKSLNKQIKLTVDAKAAAVNGKPVQLDAAPVNRDGTVYVPLRFLSQELGLSVDYYPYYGNVALTKQR